MQIFFFYEKKGKICLELNSRSLLYGRYPKTKTSESRRVANKADSDFKDIKSLNTKKKPKHRMPD